MNFYEIHELSLITRARPQKRGSDFKKEIYLHWNAQSS